MHNRCWWWVCGTLWFCISLEMFYYYWWVRSRIPFDLMKYNAEEYLLYTVVLLNVVCFLIRWLTVGCCRWRTIVWRSIFCTCATLVILFTIIILFTSVIVVIVTTTFNAKQIIVLHWCYLISHRSDTSSSLPSKQNSSSSSISSVPNPRKPITFSAVKFPPFAISIFYSHYNNHNGKQQWNVRLPKLLLLNQFNEFVVIT